MVDRDFAAEIRDVISDNFIDGTPLADALRIVADGLEQHAAYMLAALNALTERVEACEAEQVLG